MLGGQVCYLPSQRQSAIYREPPFEISLSASPRWSYLSAYGYRCGTSFSPSIPDAGACPSKDWVSSELLTPNSSWQFSCLAISMAMSTSSLSSMSMVVWKRKLVGSASFCERWFLRNLLW